jgi:hypothetical protein
MISCDGFEGAGTGINVEVVRQDGEIQTTDFDFGLPRITSISCEYNSTTLCGTHDTVLTIDGFNFGPVDLPFDADAVRIEGRTCSELTRISGSSRQTLFCNLPENAGHDFTIEIRIGGQNNEADMLFTYTDPIVTSIACAQEIVDVLTIPEYCRTSGAIVTVSGDHFGPHTEYIVNRISKADSGVCIPSQDDCGPYMCRNSVWVTPHRVFTCKMDEGMGTGMTWELEINDQYDTGPYSYDRNPILKRLSTGTPADMVHSHLYINFLTKNNVHENVYEVVRDALFAGYSIGNIYGIFDPDATGDIASQVSNSLGVLRLSTNPVVPLVHCFIKVVDEDGNKNGWTSDVPTNQLAFATLRSSLESLNCIVGVLSEFDSWSSIMGDSTSHLDLELMYYNYNNGNPGDTDATFKERVDETVGSNVDGWIRSDEEMFPENSLTYEEMGDSS